MAAVRATIKAPGGEAKHFSAAAGASLQDQLASVREQTNAHLTQLIASQPKTSKVARRAAVDDEEEEEEEDGEEPNDDDGVKKARTSNT